MPSTQTETLCPPYSCIILRILDNPRVPEKCERDRILETKNNFFIHHSQKLDGSLCFIRVTLTRKNTEYLLLKHGWMCSRRPLTNASLTAYLHRRHLNALVISKSLFLNSDNLRITSL